MTEETSNSGSAGLGLFEAYGLEVEYMLVDGERLDVAQEAHGLDVEVLLPRCGVAELVGGLGDLEPARSSRRAPAWCASD